jgi:hypothetical protein
LVDVVEVAAEEEREAEDESSSLDADPEPEAEPEEDEPDPDAEAEEGAEVTVDSAALPLLVDDASPPGTTMTVAFPPALDEELEMRVVDAPTLSCA